MNSKKRKNADECESGLDVSYQTDDADFSMHSEKDDLIGRLVSLETDREKMKTRLGVINEKIDEILKEQKRQSDCSENVLPSKRSKLLKGEEEEVDVEKMLVAEVCSSSAPPSVLAKIKENEKSCEEQLWKEKTLKLEELVKKQQTEISSLNNKINELATALFGDHPLFPKNRSVNIRNTEYEKGETIQQRQATSTSRFKSIKVLPLLKILSSVNNSNNERKQRVELLEFLNTEALLDFFKFLKYKQLYSMKQCCRRFFGLINEYDRELNQSVEFYKLEISRNVLPLSSSFLLSDTSMDLGRDAKHKFGNDFFNSGELCEAQRETWNDALSKNTPLIIPMNSRRSQSCEYRILIKKGFSIVKDEELHLKIRSHPSSINDLHFARYWLEQLSRCAFWDCSFSLAIFNPEMLRILFLDENGENADPPPIIFNMKTTSMFLDGPDPVNGEALRFADDYMRVSSCLKISLDAHSQRGVFDLLTKAGARIAQVQLNSGFEGTNMHLITSVMNHIETSRSCEGLVNEIRYSYVRSAELTRLLSNAQCVGETAGDHFRDVAYELKNTINGKFFVIIVRDSLKSTGISIMLTIRQIVAGSERTLQY